MFDDRKGSIRLAARSPLAHLTRQATDMRAGQNAGLTVSECNRLALIGISARLSDGGRLAAQVEAIFPMTLPDGPACAAAGGTTFIGIGPGQWLAAIEEPPGHNAMAELSLQLGSAAILVDQSDAKCVLRLSGPNARTVLAKGLPLDLHPRAFRPGCAAQSTIAHIGVLIWQVDDALTYHLAIPRSYAESFWRWLSGAAAAGGMVVSD
ncbi:Sarcosine oxidase subunit gamma [Hyphomicrobiales bacterium]|nr:Sarcosine oxidase subunit gamma [Hyphomicrobiales bacterium]CAH1673606.1 putative Sarcosine oxidase subunit gamma [Hyphomicrobiales bacterium]